MPYKLHPPGTRHVGKPTENRVYYATVTVRGRRAEVSTGTRDRRLAKRFAESAERRMYERVVLGGREKPAREAIAEYLAFRRPRKAEEKFYLALAGWFGNLMIDDIEQSDVDRAAVNLYPGRKPETWNRQVYTPVIAVMRHHGIGTRIKRPKMARRHARPVNATIKKLLIKNADDADLKAILTMVFYTGRRLKECVELTWERVDLKNNRIRFRLYKTDDDRWFPVDERVVVALANIGRERKGRVFRWATSSGARQALKKLTDRLNVEFTYHRGRHTFATEYVEAGASLRDLMDQGGWKDERAAMIYVKGDEARARKLMRKLR